MPLIASESQKLRLTSKHQDFEIRVFTGPKRDFVQIASIKNGLGYSPTFSTTLTAPLTTLLQAQVQSTAGFSASGRFLVNGQIFFYSSKDANKFYGLTALGAFVEHPAGSAVEQWYDITQGVTSVSVTGQMDEYSGNYTASFSGINYDSRYIDVDFAILVQVRLYPDYPSLKVGENSGGTWNGYVIQPQNVGWSNWKDLYFGYITKGSVDVDHQSNTWSCSAEGTRQYLARTEAPAISFGRKNLAERKNVKTSTVLQNLMWERRGTPGSDGEIIGAPDVSGTAAVDDDMGTLWISDGFPSATGIGSFIHNGDDDYPKIDGFCTRSPWPGIEDKYAQWISLYNPNTAENAMKKRMNWGLQAVTVGKYVGKERANLGDPSPFSGDIRSDFHLLELEKLGARIGPNKRLVLCYSKAHFHMIFGQIPDTTVIEWGFLQPDWYMNPEKDHLMLLSPGFTNGKGNYAWPVGWQGGSGHIEGVTWGNYQWPMLCWFKDPNSWDNAQLWPYQGFQPLAPGEYAQRARSGDYYAGYTVTKRPLLAYGTDRRAEWLSVDLGEFFTKVTSPFTSTGGTLSVDSTEGFAGSGYLMLDVNLYHYTSKSEKQFYGITRRAGATTTHGIGSFVYQTDGAGKLINMPMVGAIEVRRPLGRSKPTRGAVFLSDYPAPPDPLTDPNYAGFDWTRFWTAGLYGFSDNGLVVGPGTGEIGGGSTFNPGSTQTFIVNPPRRARHVAVFIEEMSNKGRAKINELAVLEPVASAQDSGLPVDSNGHTNTGALVRHYLTTRFGLSPDELRVSSGVAFASMAIAQGDYWSVLAQLAQKTDHVIINDRFNKIIYAPHPLYGMSPSQLPVFFSWDDSTIESASLQLLQTNQVSQVVLNARDTTQQQAYTVEYPDTPSSIGSKVTVDDVIIFGQANLVQKAQRHFKYANRLRSISWKTFIGDEIDIGQRHVITASLDKGNTKLNNVNFITTSVQYDISVDGGKKSWVTSVSAEEYVL